MRASKNKVLIEIKGLMEEKRGNIYLPQEGEAIESETKELLYNPNNYVRTTGVVRYVCNELDKDELVAGVYRSAMFEVRPKFRDESDREAHRDAQVNHVIAQEGMKVRVRDVDMKVEVRRGDEVYFNYRAVLENGHFVYDKSDGSFLLMVDYTKLFGRKRNGTVKMLNNYVGVEPYYAEVSHTGKVELVEKQERLFQHGRVKFIDKGYGPYRVDKDVKKGDVVVYALYSENEVRIDGREVYVMKQHDLMAKIIGKKYFAPLQDYVVVEEVKEEEPRRVALEDYDPIRDKGKVIVPGEEAIRESISEHKIILKGDESLNTGKKVGDFANVYKEKFKREAKVRKKVVKRGKVIAMSKGVSGFKSGDTVLLNPHIKSHNTLRMGGAVLLRKDDVWAVL